MFFGEGERGYYLPHRPPSRAGERPARLLKTVDDLLDDFAKFLVDLDRIVAVDAGDEIGALADVDLVFVAPFHPARICVGQFNTVWRGWPMRRTKVRSPFSPRARLFTADATPYPTDGRSAESRARPLGRSVF